MNILKHSHTIYCMYVYYSDGWMDYMLPLLRITVDWFNPPRFT